jgi:hypothetical protein
MINLEKVHKEMNNELVQGIAIDAFDIWLDDQLEPKTRKGIKRLISSSFAGKLTRNQKLAVEGLIMAKVDLYMKEVKRVTIDAEQCEVCLKYYRSKALDRCSCGTLICSECSVYDSEYGCVDCAECAWNDRSASE